MFGVKILYRYIGREYLSAFLAVLCLCAILLGLNIYFDKFDDIAHYSPRAVDIFLFVIYGLPLMIVNLMPQIALLAVLFGIGILSKNNEVLAMHACGVSYTRLGFPVMICAVLISVFSMLFAEFVLPQCALRQASVNARIKGDLPGEQETQYEPTKEWLYWTDGFDVHKMVMTHPTIIHLRSDGNLDSKMTADSGKRVSQVADGDWWVFTNATIWKYSTSAKPIGNATIRPVYKIKLKKNLDKLLGPEKKPEQMNFAELRQYIQVLHENGERGYKYATDLQRKLAFPFSTFILTLIGYTIAVRAHTRPLVVGFSFGLLAGIIYYVLDAVCSKFGHKGQINSIVAAWLPNAIFLIFAAYRLRYVNQVRD